MAELGTVFVDIEGDWKKFQSQAQKKGSGLGGVFGKIGKVAGLALVAGAGAAIAGGVASVFKASEFDAQMREVFTLMPGISGDAMSEMKDQVKDFGAEFGVMTDETIPALYQAISAGVPQDNVFDFLETAQRAAKGGVTDLETAVDGISSVVNAYGDDVLSAAEASDLMFTAVKLGKTDFEQLSGSLFNVIPTASSLGVQFGDVTAALASMTAQGVPTSVATTQLRQLFVELSKEGSNTAETFEGLAGKSFQEFIAEGGNTQQALELMGTAAAEEGQNISDMFGSVEAGAAALALSGQNAEGYADNIAAMGDSAGATDAAFQTMNGGLSATMDRLKAKFEVFMITLGQKLLPIVEQVAIWFEEKGIPAIAAFGDTMQARLVPVFHTVAGFITDTLIPAFMAVVDFFRNNQSVLIAAAAGIGAVLVAMFTSWAVSAGLAAAATLLAVAPMIAVGVAIAALVGGIVYAYQEWDVFRNVVDSVASFLRDTVWPILQQTAAIIADVVAWTISNVLIPAVKLGRQVWDVAWKAIQVAIDVAAVAIGVSIAVVKALFDNVFKPAINIARDVWNTAWAAIERAIEIASPVIGGLIDGIGTGIDTVKSVLSTMRDFWVNTAWPAIQTGIETADGIIGPLLEGISSAVGAIGDAIETVKGVWDTGWNAMKSTVDSVAGPIRTVIGGIRDAIEDIVGVAKRAKDAIDRIPGAGAIGGAIGNIGSAFGFQHGGLIPGSLGEAVPIIAHGGEMVFNRSQQAELFRLAQGRGAPQSERGGLRDVVHIDHAEFRDAVDLDAVFRRANFAMAGT